MKKRDVLLNLIAGLLIALSLIRFYFLYQSNAFSEFFWLCNHVPLIMGIAILFRANKVLIAEFCLGFVGMFIYILDYLSYFFFKISYTGNSEFFGNYIFFTSSLLMHFLTMPLAFLAIWIIHKKATRAWIYSLAHILILLPVIIYFGAAENINCLFESCIPLIPTKRFYSILLILIYFLLFVVPINFFINWIFKSGKKSKV